jgi:PTS system nitrogen regulatory IIA component
MELEAFLSEVVVDLAVSNKAALLRELGGRAAAALGLPVDQVANALLKREMLGSTGTGEGVAIPHARLSGVAKPFAMLVRLARPIDYDAIDGRAVDIVCLLLLPEHPQRQQLNALAAVARRLREKEIVRALRQAPDADALHRVIVPD